MAGAIFRAGAGQRCETGPGPAPTIPLPQLAAPGPLGRTLPLIGGPGGARPTGLALRLAAKHAPGAAFEIVVLDGAGEAALALGPFGEEDVIAVWRDLAAASGLPLMVSLGDGRLEAPFPQIGRVQLGAIRIRRRHGLLNGRRPRFLVRRQTGRLPRRPMIHCGREISAPAR